MAEQVTEMVIKVDLQCRRCYKKIRKILCEIPQVKDPTFDEKQNTVKIKVVGCDPEKVQQKICCKEGEIIICIKIVPPPPPPPPPPPHSAVKVMGWVYVCPCKCHCGRPPMCDDGCGRPAHECRCWRPPMCRDGCGWPAHECRCWRPIYSRCCDCCSDGKASSSWDLHSCDYGRPPLCTGAGYECETSCPLM